MRSLVVFVAFMVASPFAQAGEFTPRAPKEPAVEAQSAPIAKPRSKAKPVSRRTWQAKAQPKKAKKRVAEKRPLP
jgi:hypothetical protein